MSNLKRKKLKASPKNKFGDLDIATAWPQLTSLALVSPQPDTDPSADQVAFDGIRSLTSLTHLYLLHASQEKEVT